MSTIPLHASSVSWPKAVDINPLPQLLQTPSGLAMLELQGTINLPEQNDGHIIASTEDHDGSISQESPIGRLIFPDYSPQDPTSTAWMKRIYLYVGKHQRLTGEVKKLPKAIAVVRKRTEGLTHQRSVDAGVGEREEVPDELEIVEIVKYKLLFSTRPEPVGTWEVGDTI
jgi:chromosome transmission fidelity protein 8